MFNNLVIGGMILQPTGPVRKAVRFNRATKDKTFDKICTINERNFKKTIRRYV